MGFRLIAPPYFLSQTAVGAVFAVYLVRTVSSAWVGHLAGRLGRGNMFWRVVVLMLAGLAIRLRARDSKAQASSLYLFFYNLGSSATGTAGGFFWQMHGWEVPNPADTASAATSLGSKATVVRRPMRWRGNS